MSRFYKHTTTRSRVLFAEIGISFWKRKSERERSTTTATNKQENIYIHINANSRMHITQHQYIWKAKRVHDFRNSALCFVVLCCVESINLDVCFETPENWSSRSVFSCVGINMLFWHEPKKQQKLNFQTSNYYHVHRIHFRVLYDGCCCCCIFHPISAGNVQPIIEHIFYRPA